MHDDLERMLLSAEEISARVAQLGQAISRDYADKPLLMIGVLKGSVVFMADLMRAIDIPVQIDFMAVSSYGQGAQSTGMVRIDKDIDISLAGKHILIAEDILDSGKTLSHLMALLATREPASMRVVALLDKPSRRTVDIRADYTGFEVPDEFLVGYGLDYAERYRNLPGVAVLKREVYAT
ncbi:MAG: hypoxanthine phosphoribosyltransferase [Ruminococcaceae bacterium]|nr:hypoxanthine phosphoribosyltransferase [Oscillospiraceae bacterium]